MKKKNIIAIISVIFVIAIVIFGLKNSKKEEYTEHLPINFDVVTISNPSMVNEIITTTDSFKISYTNCENGSADMYVSINNESYEKYIIPESSLKVNEYVIACNKGDSIKITVTPTIGYTLAKGNFTIDY